MEMEASNSLLVERGNGILKEREVDERREVVPEERSMRDVSGMLGHWKIRDL